MYISAYSTIQCNLVNDLSFFFVVAYDNVAESDGTLIGGSTRQPDSGVVAGALQFDGIDDYVSTDAVLNPADGAFSVVAWIAGGAPGQVVLSQADGVNCG